MSAEILINGEPGTTLPVDDRGLSYGDGLFETIAVRDGQPRLWDRHMRRLESGCARLGIPQPDPTRLRAEADTVIGDSDRAVLKILVTRGSGGRGYQPPENAEPTRIVAHHPWPDFPAAWRHAGIRVRVCETRMGCSPALAGVKHLNRLEQVLARAEWGDPGIAEGLMLDAEGRVIEGVMSNLFLVRDTVLMTPDLGRCGVAGVIRGWVLDTAASLGIPTNRTQLSLDDVWAADEVFVTNAIAGVWPVRAIAEHDYPMGKVTHRMQGSLEAC